MWDVNRILEYKKYRQIGFSSAEAIDLIRECDISTLLEQLESKRAEAAYQAHYYQAKALKLQNFQLCAQPRVCDLAGGSPAYPRPNQPDISESWDGASNDT